VRTGTVFKQTVIAILVCVRDGDAGSAAGLSPPAPQASPGAGPQMLTAASYAMSLFHMLAAEFEPACPDVDVQGFLRRRALELVAGDEEAA
jgi:hypothetical protein